MYRLEEGVKVGVTIWLIVTSRGNEKVEEVAIVIELLFLLQDNPAGNEQVLLLILNSCGNVMTS